MARVLSVAGLMAAAAAPAASAADGPPAPGRYEATLCVSHLGRPESCGAAELEVGSGGDVRVQVSDIAYRLRVLAAASDVVVLHGAMQIDEFVADAVWSGTSLRFADVEKRIRYEVRAGAPRSTLR